MRSAGAGLVGRGHHLGGSVGPGAEEALGMNENLEQQRLEQLQLQGDADYQVIHALLTLAVAMSTTAQPLATALQLVPTLPWEEAFQCFLAAATPGPAPAPALSPPPPA